MGSCTRRIRGTSAIAAHTMAGLWASILIIIPTSWPGQRTPKAVESGDMAALPATAQACLWSLATHFHTRESGELRSYIINMTSPPTMALAWNVSQGGRGSPWVTTTDGTNNAIVWIANVEGDGKLYGYNGDTGATVFAGGGPNEQMSGTRQWNTGMVARGRIYFGADNKIYAFTVPIGTTTPTPTPTVTPTATPTATTTHKP